MSCDQCGGAQPLEPLFESGFFMVWGEGFEPEKGEAVIGRVALNAGMVMMSAIKKGVKIKGRR